MIRLSKITIENFKNVMNGQIDLASAENGPSILGLYGQNGSGKTSLVEAVQMLKLLFMGKVLPASFGDAIHVDSPYARVLYSFSVQEESPEGELTETGQLQYDVSIKLRQDTEFIENASAAVDVFGGVLSYRRAENGKTGRWITLIDTSSDVRPFAPAKRVGELFTKEKGLKTDLEYRMQFARWTGRSSIFCEDFQRILTEKGVSDGEGGQLVRLIRRVSYYGKNELFVISKADIGELSLPDGTLVPLDESVTIPEADEKALGRIIEHMNLVLKEIIPGLVIGFKVLARELMPNGENGVTLQLVSEKNEKTIPLKYESEGIKKIISVLHLLIRVYNQSSITVAIDELDAGIFEYLLGELLRILAEKGKGQLIFTSHNLRPLETIDKEFVAFTTTNPNARYLRMSGIRAEKNLRDYYYRDLQLGGQKETLYDPTNNFDIALAFRMAGEEPDA